MEDLINESYEFEQVDNDPLHTKYVIKDILDRSGKKTVVSYQGKKIENLLTKLLEKIKWKLPQKSLETTPYRFLKK